MSELMDYDDIAKVVILRKMGYIVGANLQVVNPITGIDFFVDIDSDQGKHIIHSFFNAEYIATITFH